MRQNSLTIKVEILRVRLEHVRTFAMLMVTWEPHCCCCSPAARGRRAPAWQRLSRARHAHSHWGVCCAELLHRSSRARLPCTRLLSALRAYIARVSFSPTEKAVISSMFT
jgi:hypothetical protein